MAKQSDGSTRRRKGLTLKSPDKRRQIVFSLKDFDINQGQSFEDWEKKCILSKLLVHLRQVSSFTIEEAIRQQVIKPYKSFPIRTNFHHPKHVAKGVRWGTIRLNGKERIAGYIDENLFSIVFLDMDHEFWITPKKNT